MKYAHFAAQLLAVFAGTNIAQASDALITEQLGYNPVQKDAAHEAFFEPAGRQNGLDDQVYRALKSIFEINGFRDMTREAADRSFQITTSTLTRGTIYAFPEQPASYLVAVNVCDNPFIIPNGQKRYHCKTKAFEFENLGHLCVHDIAEFVFRRLQSNEDSPPISPTSAMKQTIVAHFSCQSLEF